METRIYDFINHFIFGDRKRIAIILTSMISILLLFSCKKQSPPLFILKANTGIDFNNQLHPTSELNILTYLYYYNGGGVAAGDFNNDGLIDIYFTGNQVSDKLYLNQGALKFKDISSEALIKNDSGWTTGVTTVDINNDGLLDIYICKVGNFKSIKGQNLLFVNQGLDNNGIPKFKDEAGTYNLAIQSFATQASFFDYDLDGDLDMFLLNHSVHPNRTYGKGENRKKADSVSGDKLFENRQGKFIEVSQKAGIFQGSIGYGLGLGISDLNKDGYPDIYIGNDFFENDYLYLNQRNGTFSEIISADENNVGHTSHFSMGNDISDIDNDGWADIMSLDMLPEDLQAYKTSGREYNNQIYNQYLTNGYRPQFMQNMLLRNNHGKYFQEIAYVTGLSATDWSWAPLIVDLDNDGYKDVFVSNGILGATNDMDFINFIADKKIQESLDKGMEQKDLKFTEQIPERKLSNYFFKNNGDLSFSNKTSEWFKKIPSFSNGSIYADLDNDGDQDIIVNNVNEKAFVLENRTDQSINQYIKIKFKGSEKNTFGIGAKIELLTDSLSIYMENYPSRGYLSSIAPELTVGIGKTDKVNSLSVVWPSGRSQELFDIQAGATIVLDEKTAINSDIKKKNKPATVLADPIQMIDFSHRELTSYEFGREPLIPYSKGEEGPKIAIADINNDGLDDLYIGGGKKQAGGLFIQTDDQNFLRSDQAGFDEFSSSEETDNLFFDADNDGDLDLIVVSGGNESQAGQNLHPVLCINRSGQFIPSLSFPKIELNASVIKVADLDADGDQDLVIGSNAVPRKFGRYPKNYILLNDGNGNFQDKSQEIAPDFMNSGLVEDIVIQDLNEDNSPDLIVLGHWMAPTVFLNIKNKLVKQTDNGLNESNGLWNQLAAADFDHDGDIDFLAGNWGLNTRLRANEEEPMKLYIADFDQNGKEEAILTYFQEGEETVFSSKDDLVKQLPSINKKFLSYAEFAAASLEDIFDLEILKNTEQREVKELASCYFENTGNGNYIRHQLPFEAQLSSVKAIYTGDFNNDGYTDALIAGNDHGISTQLGRLDASHGLILINDKKGSFLPDKSICPDISGKVRDIDEININGEHYLVIALNNQAPIFLKVNK